MTAHSARSSPTPRGGGSTAALAFILLAVACHPRAAAATPGAPEFAVAVFEADVTVPVGHACMGGGIPDAAAVVDPLFAKGFVLLGADEPVVVLAVDWCQLNNDAFDRWREAVAEAAGTTPSRVMLATVHQHDAPICDLRRRRCSTRHGMTQLPVRPRLPRAGRPAHRGRRAQGHGVPRPGHPLRHRLGPGGEGRVEPAGRDRRQAALERGSAPTWPTRRTRGQDRPEPEDVQPLGRRAGGAWPGAATPCTR